MATIQEELILYDKFSGTFSKYIRQANQAAGATSSAQKSVDRMTQSQKTAANATNGLAGSVRNLVAGYVGLQTISRLINLSDTITSTTARIDMMNDGLQTTAQLNDMIWQSAQRSRGLYTETANLVAQLGNLAGDAFSSSQEIVAFAEQINKQIALSGASGTAASAAILQLTQGLSSGALRGEELNSILEQTPTIAQAIAKYMGVTTGEMRELASQGAVTAEVVKNAMFAAAEETNAKFESMPMTWAQVWNQAQNIVLKALNPLLDGVNWLANNLEIVGPIALGVATAFGVLAAAMLIYNAQQAVSNGLAAVSAARSAMKAGATFAEAAATTTATGAQVGFNAALLACPITWIVIGVIALVAAVYALVGAFNQASGTSVSATGIIAGAFLSLLSVVGNIIITIWNLFADVGNFIGNVFRDPVSAVKILFWDMATTVLGLISNVAHGIESLINAIPGVEVNITSGIDRLYNMAQSAAQTAKDEAGWVEYFQHRDLIDLTGAFNTGYTAGSNFASDVSSFFGSGGGNQWTTGNTPAYDPYSPSISANTGSAASSLDSIEKSVNMADEDLKNLVDMAERRYVNNINLQANTPVITVNGANTGRTQADRQALADAIEQILLEQLASNSYRSTARAYSGG